MLQTHSNYSGLTESGGLRQNFHSYSNGPSTMSATEDNLDVATECSKSAEITATYVAAGFEFKSRTAAR